MSDDHGKIEHAGMRWNGWGDPERAKELPRAVRMLLPLLLGKIRRPAPAVALADVIVTDSRLTDADRAALEAIVGASGVRTDNEARIRHAGGRSTPDLLRRRHAEQDVPDAVVCVYAHDEVLQVLTACAEHGIAVIAFGGGTSVVGGLDPERGAHHAVIALDLTGLRGLMALDPISGEATFAAGTTGPDAEAALREEGWELGHYPQSFRFATLGGFAAARSSGQNSAGYGRFDRMVTGMRVATPTGELVLGRAPGSAAGPDLMALMLGSEGIYGVITQVRVRVHPAPEERICAAWTFTDFSTGAAAMRALVQRGAAPTVVRLSDEAETAVSLAQVGKIGRALSRGVSMVTVFEGERTAERAAVADALLRAAGGESVGDRPAADWLAGRFDGPYMRDALLDAGVFCETLETATTWARLAELRAAVTGALTEGCSQEGAKSYVMCHISHVYPTGASLYFTVLANFSDEPLERWQRVKHRTSDAIAQAGGTISHHHGVGRDHRAWMPEEIGEVGVRVLRAVKAELDPTGILNPGALLPGVSGAA